MLIILVGLLPMYSKKKVRANRTQHHFTSVYFAVFVTCVSKPPNGENSVCVFIHLNIMYALRAYCWLSMLLRFLLKHMYIFVIIFWLWFTFFYCKSVNFGNYKNIILVRIYYTLLTLAMLVADLVCEHIAWSDGHS